MNEYRTNSQIIDLLPVADMTSTRTDICLLQYIFNQIKESLVNSIFYSLTLLGSIYVHA